MNNDVYVHPTALVESQQIGDGTRVWAFAHVMKDAAIGMACNIGDHCFVESGAHIGNYVTVKNGNMIWEGITLEDGVFVGPRVFFINDMYPRSARYDVVNRRSHKDDWLVSTHVQEGASLGAAAVILGGVTIGAFAMVAAGAVVTSDVPPHALMRGTPARRHGWVCLCGLPLSIDTGSDARCACDKTYTRQGPGLICTSR